MASKTVLIMTDDTDGSQADQTVRFSIDGTQYEIDLSGANAGKLRDALQPYVDAGRKTGGRRAGRRRTATTDKDETKAIRDWARQQGMEVSDRGRVPAQILDAYRAGRASHPKK
jgi:Lsr2